MNAESRQGLEAERRRLDVTVAPASARQGEARQWLAVNWTVPGLLALLLVVAALVSLGRSQAPALAPVTGGEIAPGPVFLDGIYGPERHLDGSLYRWTSGNALVQVRGAFFAAPAYRAEVRLRADNPAGPQPLTLLVGGQAVARVTPESRFRLYRLLIGPGGEGAELWLALQTPTFVAAGDPRPLGVMLTDVRLRPLTRPDLAGAALAGLGLAALWGLLRAARLPRSDALALTGVAGLGLAALAILNRPAALPPTWLAALMLSGVFLAALSARPFPARLGLAALMPPVALASLIWPSWLSDDAFISFRYAQNLALGHGLVYNVGERVEGYTNFLWTVMAAGVLRLGGDLALWSHASGVLLGLLIVVGTYRVAEPLIGPPWALVAALLTGTSQSLLLYTARGSGLETGLFTLLALVGGGAYLTRERSGSRGLAAAGLAFGLAALTRPEGLLLFALTALHARLTAAPGRQRGPAERWRATLPPLLVLGVPFLALFGPYFLWRLGYYGDLLPNTFYAKTGGGLKQIERGLAYAGAFALTIGGPLLLVIAAPWLRSWRAALASWRSYVLLVTLTYSAYIIVVGGDHFRGERFFVPLVPWFALLIADGLATSIQTLPAPARLVRTLLALGLAAGSLAALARTAPFDTTIRGLDESVWIWREIGWWLQDHSPPEASIAVAGAGAVAFYGQRTAIDMYGLTDRHIGRLQIAGMGEGVPGHEKRDPGYILHHRRPTYIPRIWDDYFGGRAALEPSYRLIRVVSRSGRALELWERREE
ncbi:MAG: hypothetical protein RMK84_11890 [Oscillochloridaceae bacterium]|nr:hypothetical protein [Chloroflexaceae bacterium]MDW8390818.1 hypothetical protein [Oscillochloridaceae bacterium]